MARFLIVPLLYLRAHFSLRPFVIVLCVSAFTHSCFLSTLKERIGEQVFLAIPGLFRSAVKHSFSVIPGVNIDAIKVLTAAATDYCHHHQQ